MERHGSLRLLVRRVAKPLETLRVMAPRLLPERFRSRLKNRLNRVLGWVGVSSRWQPESDELAGVRVSNDESVAPPGPALVWLGAQAGSCHPGWVDGESWPVVRVSVADSLEGGSDPGFRGAGTDVVLSAIPRSRASAEGGVGLEEGLAKLGALRLAIRIRTAGVVCVEPEWEPLAKRLGESLGWRVLPGSAIERPPEELARLWPRVSILIVSHGNPEVTRLCLESIFAWTSYPNFEVVVVDNGSDGATREMLQAASQRWSDLAVVLNRENRGFAAACNQAAEAATGEVLCLLNNDTVVTPGWLSVLAGAVDSDRRLGMVGPVSNGVANEARVQSSYRSLEGLREWAESWVWQHDGESFSIPMLALFCAVMRREVWEEVGPLDEDFGLGMFEDDDYSRRLRRAGFDLSCRRDSFVHHWQQMSFGQLDQDVYLDLYEKNQRYFREKWAGDRG